MTDDTFDLNNVLDGNYNKKCSVFFSAHFALNVPQKMIFSFRDVKMIKYRDSSKTLSFELKVNKAISFTNNYNQTFDNAHDLCLIIPVSGFIEMFKYQHIDLRKYQSDTLLIEFVKVNKFVFKLLKCQLMEQVDLENFKPIKTLLERTNQPTP